MRALFDRTTTGKTPSFPATQLASLVGIAFFLTCCSPTLDRSCETDSQCLIGESCVNDLCKPIASSLGDTATDQPLDVTTDLVDADDLTNDQPTSDSEVSDLVVDETTEDRLDGDVDQPDGVSTCSPEYLFTKVAPLVLVDRCLDSQAVCGVIEQPNCARGTRTAQLVEVPLHSGYLQPDVVGYFSFNSEEATDEDHHPALRNFGSGDEALAVSAYSAEAGGRSGRALRLSTQPAILSDFSLGEADEWTIAFHFQLCGTDCMEAPQNLFTIKADEGDQLSLSVFSQDGHYILDFTNKLAEVDGQVSFDLPYTADDWYHVAIVGRTDHAPRFYINGQAITADWSEPPPDSLPDSDTITLWAAYEGGATDFITIDELILSNRALSPLEIHTLRASNTPLGTSLFEGVSQNYSDLRLGVFDSDEELVRLNNFDIVGVRPGPPPDTVTLGSAATSDCYLHLDDVEIDRENQVTRGNCYLDDTRGAPGIEPTRPGRFGYQEDNSIGVEAGAYFEIAYPDPIMWDERDFTIEFWLRPDAAGVVLTLGQVVVDMPAARPGVIEARMEGAETSQVLWPDGNWHHIALILEPGGTGPVRLAVDGVEEDGVCVSDDSCPTAGTIKEDGHPIILGSQNADSFSGDIDDVVIHRRARSVEEIRRRNRPAIPVMRFRASTGDGDGECDTPYLAYHLIYGNEFAPQPGERRLETWDEEHCVGVLSHCNGYLGWWRFEEPLPDPAYDITDNAIDLSGTTCDRAVPAVGHYGQAAKLDGTSCLLARPSREMQLESLEFLAIEVIAQLNPVAEAALIALGSGSRIDWYFGLDENHKPVFRYRQGDTAVVLSNPSFTTMSPEHFHTMSAGINLALSSGELSLDGEGEPAMLQSVSPAPLEIGEELVVGRLVDETGPVILIEELRLMNRALDTGEGLLAPPVTPADFGFRPASETARDVCLDGL